MEVFLFAPAGAGPHSGLVLCQHIPVGHTGIENDAVTLKTAERYCANGYAVAVPFIQDRIGIAGHCWGGRVAWLGACTNPRYKACSIFYGGRVKLVMGEGNPPAIELAPAICCPVIGFFGNEDTNPSPADVDDYDAALTKAGVEHVFHRYDGAGHAFQSFNNPERYRHEASEDAWGKGLAFFAEKLKK